MQQTAKLLGTLGTLGTAALAGLFLASCGGGGGSGSSAPTPPPASAAEGLWVGTTNSNRAVTGLVLDDGSDYVLYSVQGNASIIAGVIQGNGTATGGSFSSSNGRDFNLEGLGVLAATVSASYNARQTLNGSVSYSVGAPTTFTSTFNTNYDVTPTLAAVAGTYSGQVAFSLGVENATVAVSGAGALSGAGASGCAVSGSVTPRSRGNAYNLTLTFGGSPCFFTNQTMSGIAYFDSATRRLYAVTPNASRTDGVLFVGVKP